MCISNLKIISIKFSFRLLLCSHLIVVFVFGAGREAMAALHSEVDRVGEDGLQDSVIHFIRTLRQVQVGKSVYSSWCAGDLNMAQHKSNSSTRFYKSITLRWLRKHFFVQLTVENMFSSVQ